jgi:hypothetical protein
VRSLRLPHSHQEAELHFGQNVDMYSSSSLTERLGSYFEAHGFKSRP